MRINAEPARPPTIPPTTFSFTEASPSPRLVSEEEDGSIDGVKDDGGSCFKEEVPGDKSGGESEAGRSIVEVAGAGKVADDALEALNSR